MTTTTPATYFVVRGYFKAEDKFSDEVHCAGFDAAQSASQKLIEAGAEWTSIKLAQQTIGYSHILVTNYWDVDESGNKTTREPDCIYLEKNGRKACVDILIGYFEHGRSNAYMTPIQPAGRTRTYKNKANARCKAVEFVLGK